MLHTFSVKYIKRRWNQIKAQYSLIEQLFLPSTFVKLVSHWNKNKEFRNDQRFFIRFNVIVCLSKTIGGLVEQFSVKLDKLKLESHLKKCCEFM